jgi:arylsulfatase A-like enzyme/tetratricopeptide (TPR) repeat protein
MPRRAAAALLAIVVVVAVWVAWRRSSAPPPIPPGACAGCNVLLVTIDTLRSDRVGAFGGPPGLTPNLDRLAEHALRLTRAYSSAPLTLPSHTSIMTGLSPPAHGARANGLYRLGPDTPTLASVLKQSGYRTGAFVGAFVLDARFGLNRGFDVYDDRYGEKHAGDDTEGAERRAEEVIKPATAWITSALMAAGAPETNRRWFAWVHLYDPHEPYRAPEPYASQHEPYDAEVAYTDAMVGKLLSDLTAAGQLERTLVMVAADHGESLGEHDERTHGVFAYDVTLRVPWLVWAGSRFTGRGFAGLTRLIDLAPTLLEIVGVQCPQTVEGRSVLQAVNARDTSGPAAYFEAMDANLTRNWAPLTGIVSGGSKLIDLPIPELYDLASDPGETTNLFAREGERARTLTALLHQMAAEISARAGPVAKITLNAESRQRLQALGYVASSADPRQRVYGEADDPKTMLRVSNDLNRALADFKAGSQREAMSAVRGIIGQHPGFTTAYGVLASIQHDTGDLRGAIATLEDVVQREIANQSVMVVLAGYLQEAGALEKSIGLLDAVVASHPDYADAYNSLGVAYSRAGRHDRARAAFEKVLELDPTSATAYENLGVDEAGAGDLAEAEADLARALELDPRLPGAHNALGTVYLRQRRQPDAIAHWKTAVQLDPRLYDALYNLGTVLYSLGRRDEARPYLERFVKDAPPFRYAADIARIRRMLGTN